MNKEAFDLYVVLQPKFIKAMGPWQVGDWGLTEDGRSILVADECDADWENSALTVKPTMLHLPLPIDPRNPERGCWFMLTLENRADKIFLNELATSENSDLVILKKLASQEGV
jgi:hypothetical protein